MSTRVKGPTGRRGAVEESDEACTRAALRDAYARVRRQTEELARPLSPEDQCAQSMPDASPTKWHRAHTTWFFETFVLTRAATGYQPIDDAYAVLFNSYYNAVGDQYPRPQRGLLTRPSAVEVTAYRQHVDDAMLGLLDGALSAQTAELVLLGLHHEQQHQELLLTDLAHLWSHNPLEPVYAAPPTERAAAAPVRWIEHPGGLVDVGHDGDGFAYDNEGPRHPVMLQPFELASRLVTAGEFAEFMDDGGYRCSSLWLDAGWSHVREQGWTAPLYWRRDDGRLTHFTLEGRRAVDPHEPVTHLSYFEADAYARWAGARLPTELEWEACAPSAPKQALGAPLRRVHPSAAGDLAQWYGACWQWTRSDYAPYPGFRVAEGAVGEYNGKFMCGQYVLRGSSCVTPVGHARRTYRNFFPPSARWQVTGLRLARDL